MIKAKKCRTKSERTRRKEKIISFVVLFVAAIFFAFPLVYMIGTSLKTDIDLQLHPDRIFPSAGEWTLERYSSMIINNGKVDQIPFWILNSLWSSLAMVALTVLTDLMVAFAVVFLQFKGKNVMMKFLFLWMAIPGIIGTAPSYVMYVVIKQALGIGSGIDGYFYAYFWIVVPAITSIFNMLLMRNFFLSIPKDIIDSAKSDGASYMTIFRRIVVPLAKSTIMLIILFTFVNAWNNLMWPQLIFVGEDPRWNTVTSGLIGWTGGSAWGHQGDSMAVSVFTTIPIIIIFAITQNKMIDGLASTGIKQ